VISEAVIEETSLTIHADCDRNAASFPIPRQNRLNILRDNCFNVLLAAQWRGSKQSSDQDCKNFRSIHRAILNCLSRSLQCCCTTVPETLFCWPIAFTPKAVLCSS